MVNRRWVRWTAGALVVVLVGGGAAAAIVGWQQRRDEEALLARLESADPQERADAFYDARYATRPEAVQRLLDAFDHEDDPVVLSKAAYAIMCTRDPRGLPLLVRRAEAGPDREVRAEFMVYIARHEAGADSRVAWMRAGLGSDEPWRRLGAAAGLLYLGRPEGGATLIDLARHGTPEHRDFAMAQLRKVVQPMTEAVAWPIDWPGEGLTPPEGFWDELARFWTTHGDARLLADVLGRLFGDDRQWRQLKRLLHARQYAEDLLN
jgi:HEAT repeat protein